MSRVVHFEIQASDPQKLIAFYSGLFGWTFEQWGNNDYWMITTGASDQPGINGGLLPRRGPVPARGQPVNAFVNTIGVGLLLALAGSANDLPSPAASGPNCRQCLERPGASCRAH